jgi:hypothetical protein
LASVPSGAAVGALTLLPGPVALALASIASAAAVQPIILRPVYRLALASIPSAAAVGPLGLTVGPIVLVLGTLANVSTVYAVGLVAIAPGSPLAVLTLIIGPAAELRASIAPADQLSAAIGPAADLTLTIEG